MNIFRQDSQTVFDAFRYFRRPLPFSSDILHTTKVELVTFCWQVFAVSKLIKISHDQKNCQGGGEGALLNYSDRGPTLGFLPRALQQLKLLHRVERTSHF